MAQLGKDRWEAIEKEYIEALSEKSYNQISKTYNVSQPAVSMYANKNEWKLKRKSFWKNSKKLITISKNQISQHIYDKNLAVEQDKKLLQVEKALLQKELKRLIDNKETDTLEFGRLTVIFEKLVDIEIKVFGQLFDDADPVDDNEYIAEYGN